jgi:hypothetical protein
MDREMTNTYKMMAGNPEVKRPLGSPRRGWEIIKFDIKEIGWQNAVWIDPSQVSESWRDVVNTVMNLRLP